MLELGRYRKKMHADVGQYARRKKVDVFLGFGELTINCINDEHESNKSLKYLLPLSSLSLASVISFKSWPAQKTFPVAEIIITFIEWSLDAELI